MAQTTDLSVPKGHGIVRVAHNLRNHVTARDWQEMGATDFWFVSGNGDAITTTGATNPSGLGGWGWTATSLAFTNLITGDFFSSSDDTPPHNLSDASGDLLRSPIVFGSYSHRLMAGQFLGYLPTRLVLEMYAAFTVASADESATNIGWHNANAIVAGIYSDGVNFQLSNGVTTDAGAAIDNSWHQWRIVTNSATSLHEWFIDGVSQGTLAITADVWPACANLVASTTNRFGVAWIHCWYE